MRDEAGIGEKPLDVAKFRDPLITADGGRRASVGLRRLDTLWFNTGTLCNITCENCYIESSPRNDRLAYLGADEVCVYLDEIESLKLETAEIGFTGGEPFMNPAIIDMLEQSLARGYRALALTNAMKPMMNRSDGLTGLRRQRVCDKCGGARALGRERGGAARRLCPAVRRA